MLTLIVIVARRDAAARADYGAYRGSRLRS
jgi:hypothetical protein